MNKYSGKFVFRIGSDMHETLSKRAAEKGISLNRFCSSLIEDALNRNDSGDTILDKITPIIEILKKKFSKSLTGVVLFGSYARDEATESSDIDLLIILTDDCKITRSLYSYWDENIEWPERADLNPHFVNLPSDPKKVTGLWFEVAQSGKIIFEKNKKVSAIIKKLKKLIDDDIVRRYVSNGHPYWVWREDEKQKLGA